MGLGFKGLGFKGLGFAVLGFRVQGMLIMAYGSRGVVVKVTLITLVQDRGGIQMHAPIIRSHFAPVETLNPKP